jgi:hypothetical protein
LQAISGKDISLHHHVHIMSGQHLASYMHWIPESLVQSGPRVKLTAHVSPFSKSENVRSIVSMTSIRLQNIMLPFIS